MDKTGRKGILMIIKVNKFEANDEKEREEM
jgi:hypothetical protein